MSRNWETEELDNYCQLFQTLQKAMLEAGYNLEDFSITIGLKEMNNGNI